MRRHSGLTACLVVLLLGVSAAADARVATPDPCRGYRMEPVLTPINTSEQKIRLPAELPDYGAWLAQTPLQSRIPNIAARIESPDDKTRYALLPDLFAQSALDGVESLIRGMMRRDPYSLLQHQAVQRLSLCWQQIEKDELPSGYFYHAGLFPPGQAGAAEQLARLRAALDNPQACRCGDAGLGVVAHALALVGDKDDVPRLQALGQCQNDYVRLSAAYALYNHGAEQAAATILQNMANRPEADSYYRQQARVLLQKSDKTHPVQPPADCAALQGR
jgi:hypothetical protein